MSIKNTFIYIFGSLNFAVLICYCFLDLFVNFLTNSEFILFYLFILNSLKKNVKHNKKYYSTNKTDNNFNKTKNKIYNNTTKNNKNKFDWFQLLIIIGGFILFGLLDFFGINPITDLITIHKFCLIINLIFGLYIAYYAMTLFLMINSPQDFLNSKLFKYLPKFYKNYYLYNINLNKRNEILYKIYLNMYVLNTVIVIFTSIFCNTLLILFT